MEKTILVVDDDPELGHLLHDYFCDWGYHVLLACDGNQMRDQLADNQIDLVVLDFMLPGEDGFALCRALRADSDIPVLMLTANGDEMNRIIGLEMGADDYINKPFNPRELLARVKNIMRRTGEAGDARLQKKAKKLYFSGWVLDLDAHHLVDADEVVVPLSSGEFKLLKALTENPNRVLTRDQLMDIISSREAGPFDRTIDVLISRLRRRLGNDEEQPLIRTIRSEGYMLVSRVERRA
jgi:two-component system, OmpR family, response regulator